MEPFMSINIWILYMDLYGRPESPGPMGTFAARADERLFRARYGKPIGMMKILR